MVSPVRIRTARLVATMLPAALDYAARGWAVIPVHWIRSDGACSCGHDGCGSAGKHPRLPRGCKDATTERATIERWWRQTPQANIAIATGRPSGLLVLDIDAKSAGEETLADLVGAHGALPPTITVISGGGGRHFYFRYPEGRVLKNSAGKLGRGVDTRVDGGMIVAPPSMHASGAPYAWAPGRAPGEVDLADAPDWFLDMLEARTAPMRPATTPAAPAGDPKIAYAYSALSGELARMSTATEGTRNDTLVACGRSLGSLVGAGLLDRGTVEAALTGAALAAGLSATEIAATLRSGMEYGIRHPRSLEDIGARGPERRRPANAEAQAARRNRLRGNGAAMNWLAGQGLSDTSIEHFGFGLDGPYISQKTGQTYADALTFPLRAEDGTQVGMFVKANIPTITQNPKSPWWSPGEPETFFAAPRVRQTSVVVCDMPLLWRLWQALQDTELADDVQLIASSHSDAQPKEWSESPFWDRWTSVYVASADDRVAGRIFAVAARPVSKVRPPAESWEAALAGGNGAEVVQLALGSAVLLTESVQKTDDGARLGRFAYRPIDIGRSFHNGHLYYPIDTLVRSQEVDAQTKESRVVERLETLIIRNDGEALRVVEMPAPAGTPPDRRVMRLNDGTLVDGRPKASAFGSWSWESISRFREAAKNGRRLTGRSVREMVMDLRDALECVAWLPYPEDYTVLALTAAASYCQAVFQAVPLVLLCGEAGSGKSTIGITMANISANGTIVGQVTASAAARHIHETRGLIVLDDLEGIASKAGKDAGSFSELVQWLKVSYNRDTAVKMWTDHSKNFKVERLNGFGIKIINNTQGVDSILGSRMIRIQTHKMPAAVAQTRGVVHPVSPDRLSALRDELHVWTAESVTTIAETYALVCPSAAERSEQIAAPLRVIAHLCDDPKISAELEQALARSRNSKVADDPEEALLEACTNLVRAGYTHVAITHVIMEIRRLLDANAGQTNVGEIPEVQQPEWVGRMLRLRDIVDSAAPGQRQRLFGKMLRVYPFSKHFVEQTLAGHPQPERREPTAFCVGCDGCTYRAGCPIMEARVTAESKATRFGKR